jgi:hypothetical protein
MFYCKSNNPLKGLGLCLLSLNYFGITDKLASIKNHSGKNMMIQISAIINQISFTYQLILGAILAICVLPLKVGLINIMHKSQQQEPSNISDLFIAYQGANFIKYSLYFLGFTSLTALLSLLPLLGSILTIILIILSILVSPIMLLEDKSASQAISQFITMAKPYFSSVFVLIILACLGSYLGILLFGFGLLLTWPFSVIMCYSIYHQLQQNNINFRL